TLTGRAGQSCADAVLLANPAATAAEAVKNVRRVRSQLCMTSPATRSHARDIHSASQRQRHAAPALALGLDRLDGRNDLRQRVRIDCDHAWVLASDQARQGVGGVGIVVQPGMTALPSPGSGAHIARMAKTPKRDPAKHSKKDPAKPTRAKAARPDLPPIDAALAKLLNPAIERGEAGPGSQTGLTPPPDNSFDRRADFSAAHRARKSTQEGFGEAQQRGYVAKTPSGERTPSDEGAPSGEKAPPGELDPDLARVWGIDTDDDTPSEALSPEKPALPAVRNQKLANEMIGSRASQTALDALLREGRPEFAEQPWVPHRPPRPEKSEGGFRLVIKSEFEPKGDQPQAIDELVE